MFELAMGGLGGIITTALIYFIKSRIDKKKEISLENHKSIINRKQFYLDNFYQDYRVVYNKMYEIESTLETFCNARSVFHITNENAGKYVSLNEQQLAEYDYGENIDLVKRVNYIMFLQILSDNITEMRDKYKTSSILFDDKENMLLNNFVHLANESMLYLRENSSDNLKDLTIGVELMDFQYLFKNLEELRKYTREIRSKFRNRFVFEEDTN